MTSSSSWSRQAMASTSTPLAVAAALWALDCGGTAVDAAIAADAVLGVVQPFWTGIGGDVFCLVDDGAEVVAFNGSGPAPAALRLELCQAAREADPVPERLRGYVEGMPDFSPLCVTVPGAVDAWDQLAERFGRLGLARLLEPARQLAAEGYPVGRLAAAAWVESAGRLQAGSPFAPVVAPGQRVANPALAESLEAIAKGGRRAHYEGPWASAAVAATAAAGGVLAADDLAAHRGEWVAPISGCYRGHTVFQHPPNGQGAAVLAALARRDREAPGQAEDPATVAAIMAAIHEGMELANQHVADPRFGAVPDFWSGRDTVYTAVVAGGVAVSLISSVFWQWGSGIVAGGAVLQNRGAGFSLDPRHPNAAGPGKRPFHTIIPALVREGDRPWAAIGVVGGPMQPQGQVQVLSHLIDHGKDPQAALDAPRARWLGRDLVGLEAGLGPDVATALAAVGFRVLPRPLPPAELGAGQVVRIHADGWLEGGADPRRDGVAFGR
jgi:gamma-glutamyltranspeptidase/glutathione hydrolase